MLTSNFIFYFPIAAEDILGNTRPAVTTFVATIQRLHRLRKNLQARNAIVVLSCDVMTPDDAPIMRSAVGCERCGHLSYLASLVADAKLPQTEWVHLCLDCGEENQSCGQDSLLFVKPIWGKMEKLACRLESLLKRPVASAPAANPTPASAAITAAGATRGGVRGSVEEESENGNFNGPCLTLPLDGCHFDAISNPQIDYVWEDLGEIGSVLPSWVGPTGTAATAAAGTAVVPMEEERILRIGGTRGGGSSFDPNDIDGPPEKRRKVSEKLEGQNQLGGGYAVHDVPAEVEIDDGSSGFQFRASAAPLQAATLLRNDRIMLAGAKYPILRRVAKLDSTGKNNNCALKMNNFH